MATPTIQPSSLLSLFAQLQPQQAPQQPVQTSSLFGGFQPQLQGFGQPQMPQFDPSLSMLGVSPDPLSSQLGIQQQPSSLIGLVGGSPAPVSGKFALGQQSPGSFGVQQQSDPMSLLQSLLGQLQPPSASPLSFMLQTPLNSVDAQNAFSLGSGRQDTTSIGGGESDEGLASTGEASQGESAHGESASGEA